VFKDAESARRDTEVLVVNEDGAPLEQVADSIAAGKSSQTVLNGIQCYLCLRNNPSPTQPEWTE
jgi:hypothetical protein